MKGKESRTLTTWFLRLICSVLHWSGILHYHDHQTPWVNSLHRFYVCCVYCVIFLFNSFHFWSMASRSTRNLSEFLSALLEDLAVHIALMEVLSMCIQSGRIKRIIHHMDTAFMPVNPRVHAICIRNIFNMYYAFMPWAGAFIVASLLQTFFHLTDHELTVLREVYRTEQPERRLPTKIKVPYVDETISPAFELIVLWQLYLGVLFIEFAVGVITFFPIIIMHLEGQYMILGQEIMKLGKGYRLNARKAKHIKRNITTQVCTNIEIDISNHSDIDGTDAVRSIIKRKEDMQREQNLEHAQLRRIIVIHQGMYEFQNEIHFLWSAVIVPLVVCNSLGFTLGLYQLIVNPGILSYFSICRYITQLIAMAIQYFILNDSSETLNRCNEILTMAVRESAWYRCSPSTRRDLQILLRRVQRNNHLSYCYGMIVLSRDHFIKGAKGGYTLSNFILKAKK